METNYYKLIFQLALELWPSLLVEGGLAETFLLSESIILYTQKYDKKNETNYT